MCTLCLNVEICDAGQLPIPKCWRHWWAQQAFLYKQEVKNLKKEMHDLHEECKRKVKAVIHLERQNMY